MGIEKEKDWAIWARQLEKEYQALSYQYGIHLGALRIEIRSEQAELGLYHPRFHLVSLQSAFIELHSWHIVLEVFKHELAHAYLHIYAKDSFESSPHGEAFQRACEVLRVAPWARKASLSIEEAYQKGGEQSDLSRKVKKLLSLAESSNKHEAALALQRAMELSQQIPLDMEFTSCYVPLRKKRIEDFEYALTTLLVDYYHVKIIFYPMFDAPSQQLYRGFEILGRKDHVEMADYVFGFLHATFLKLWSKYKQGHRNSYLKGLIKGFRESLDQSKQVYMVSMGSGLVPAKKDARLDEFFKYKYPRTTHTRSSAQRYDNEAYLSGQGDGRKVRVLDPLKKSQNTMLLV
jgi:predicted SprT family Zn-dependent metalloprotease